MHASVCLLNFSVSFRKFLQRKVRTMKPQGSSRTGIDGVFRHTRQSVNQRSSGHSDGTNQANMSRSTRIEPILSSLQRFFRISSQIRDDNLLAIALQRQFDNLDNRIDHERLETENEDQPDATVIDLTENIDLQSNPSIFVDRDIIELEVVQPLFQRTYTYYRRPGWKAEDCPICFEIFQSMEENTLLDCNHRYHAACIRSWFDENAEKTCPLCRAGPYN